MVSQPNLTDHPIISYWGPVVAGDIWCIRHYAMVSIINMSSRALKGLSQNLHLSSIQRIGDKCLIAGGPTELTSINYLTKGHMLPVRPHRDHEFEWSRQSNVQKLWDWWREAEYSARLSLSVLYLLNARSIQTPHCTHSCDCWGSQLWDTLREQTSITYPVDMWSMLIVG